MGNMGVWNVDDKGIEHKGTLRLCDFEEEKEEKITKESLRYKKATTELNEIEEIFNKALEISKQSHSRRSNSFFAQPRATVAKSFRFDAVPKD